MMDDVKDKYGYKAPEQIKEIMTTSQHTKEPGIWVEQQNDEEVQIFCDDQQGGQELMCTFEYYKGAKLDAEDICQRYNTFAGIENPKEAVAGLVEALERIVKTIDEGTFMDDGSYSYEDTGVPLILRNPLIDCRNALKPWRERSQS